MVVVEHMLRALALAEQGRGRTRTNPLVGAVIVKDGRVIGEGFHREFGADHAEVDALNRAGESVTGADLYVNLEPCAHHGKTPPCVDAIIDAGIRRVIIAMVDPNPVVAGNGIARLRAAGIAVETGPCSEQAARLNEVYLKFIRTGLPFVTVKIAQTLDGYIADTRGRSKWISSEASRHRVHQLRAQVDAVLIGANTARCDNPQLTAHGLGNDPMRLVLSGSGRLDGGEIFAANPDGKSILLTGNTTASPGQSWKVSVNDNGRVDLEAALRVAAQNGIASLLVEGGAQVFSSFIERRMVDKFILVVAPKVLGGGKAALKFTSPLSVDHPQRLRVQSSGLFGGDQWIEGYPEID